MYHVYARGNDKRLIYEDDRDRRLYLTTLGVVVDACGWLLLAYCLMDTHVHLLVETPEPNLGTGMRRLHGNYALLFNRRHRRCGHLFQGRYGAKRIRDDAHLLTAVSYVAANPVEAGLCGLARQWEWSSVPSALDGAAPAWLAHTHLLKYLAGIGGGSPTDRFAELVGETAATSGPAHIA